MLAKDFDAVTLMNIRNVRHVDHCHIHADIANIGCLLAIDQTVACATTQMAVQTIGITDRNGSNEAVTRKNALATVAHRFVLGDGTELEYRGLEGGDWL